MSTILEERALPVPHYEERFPITRRVADWMRDNGEIIGRYELIDGEIISKTDPEEKRIPVTRRTADWMRDNGEIIGRYELIDGEIISKTGQKARHAFVVTRLTGWLVRVFGADRVRIQLPMLVSDPDSRINEPEPDAAVLARPAEAFVDDNPGPPDVLIAFEVADTTLGRDLGIKARLYARAQVGQYVVIDLSGRRVLLHDGPTDEGYERLTTYAADETFTLALKPRVAIGVAELLPPV
jgi:Uma2 family endonuclease